MMPLIAGNMSVLWIILHEVFMKIMSLFLLSLTLDKLMGLFPGFSCKMRPSCVKIVHNELSSV